MRVNARCVLWFALALGIACGGASQEAPEERSRHDGVTPGITAATLLAETRILSSDEFEGRGPGSVGEAKTVAYLSEQFSNLGLSPGNPDGTWVQRVPLVGITPVPGDTLTVSSGGDTRTFMPGGDYVAWTKHVVDQVEIDAEFVFVGYGAVAPEYDWDDFENADVAGKILLFLVNDPPLDDLFGGPAMTYYGRWTYKHEIAAIKGAAGSFVIHEPDAAGYPWGVIGSSPHGESFDLVAPDQNASRATVEGWMQRSAAEALFEMAGLDFEEAKQAAASSSFRPVSLGVTGATRIRNTLRTIDSQNVVAKLDGTDAADEIVMFIAHWDHLGKEESLSGDQIFNGAADNATGTAGSDRAHASVHRSGGTATSLDPVSRGHRRKSRDCLGPGTTGKIRCTRPPRLSQSSTWTCSTRGDGPKT